MLGETPARPTQGSGGSLASGRGEPRDHGLASERPIAYLGFVLRLVLIVARLARRFRTIDVSRFGLRGAALGDAAPVAHPRGRVGGDVVECLRQSAGRLRSPQQPTCWLSSRLASGRRAFLCRRRRTSSARRRRYPRLTPVASCHRPSLLPRLPWSVLRARSRRAPPMRAVAGGAAEAVAGADALADAAVPPDSVFEQPKAKPKPRAAAHTSRQRFILFLSMARKTLQRNIGKHDSCRAIQKKRDGGELTRDQISRARLALSSRASSPTTR